MSICSTAFDAASNVWWQVVAAVGWHGIRRVEHKAAGAIARRLWQRRRRAVSMKEVVNKHWLWELFERGPVLARLQPSLVVGGHHIEGNILNQRVSHGANAVQLEQLRDFESRAAHHSVLLEELGASEAVAEGVDHDLAGVAH